MSFKGGLPKTKEARVSELKLLLHAEGNEKDFQHLITALKNNLSEKYLNAEDINKLYSILNPALKKQYAKSFNEIVKLDISRIEATVDTSLSGMVKDCHDEIL